MPLSKEEFDEICRETCPHCKEGLPLRFRTRTQEWTHDAPGKHAFCLASYLRKSRFAEEAKG